MTHAPGLVMVPPEKQETMTQSTSPRGEAPSSPRKRLLAWLRGDRRQGGRSRAAGLRGALDQLALTARTRVRKGAPRTEVVEHMRRELKELRKGAAGPLSGPLALTLRTLRAVAKSLGDEFAYLVLIRGVHQLLLDLPADPAQDLAAARRLALHVPLRVGSVLPPRARSKLLKTWVQVLEAEPTEAGILSEPEAARARSALKQRKRLEDHAAKAACLEELLGELAGSAGA